MKDKNHIKILFKFPPEVNIFITNTPHKNSKLNRDILENIIIKRKTSTNIFKYIKYVYVVIILYCKIKKLSINNIIYAFISTKTIFMP